MEDGDGAVLTVFDGWKQTSVTSDVKKNLFRRKLHDALLACKLSKKPKRRSPAN